MNDEGPDTSKNPVRDFEIPDFRIGFRISKQDFGFHFFDKECERDVTPIITNDSQMRQSISNYNHNLVSDFKQQSF